MKYFFIGLFLISFQAFSQKNFSLTGTITDQDGEALIGATVIEKNNKKGTTTDVSGNFVLKLPEGKHILQISFVGYENYEEELNLNKDKNKVFRLKSSDLQLSEIEIVSESVEDKVQINQMSVEKLTSKEAKLLPALFGEVDIIKILQLKPGVQSGGEGTSGLYIRGGGADQNLVLLDNAVIYNPNHLFGFFSVFNSDAVDKIDLYKGDFPAQFGGRLSSVIDVSLKKSTAKKLSGSGGIGLISSRLALETPIGKKSSLIVSGRRTYVDVFTRAANQAQASNKNWTPIPDYFFYDLTAKFDHQLNEKNNIYWSAYLGRDVFEISDIFKARFAWGNTASVLGWKHFFNKKLSVNNAFHFSDYNYELTNQFDVFSIQVGSAITDVGFQSNWFYEPTEKQDIQFGFTFTNHSFKVGRFQGGSSGGQLEFSAGNDFKGNQWGVYLNDDIDLGNRLQVGAGLRVSGFEQQNTVYWGLEPRLSARFKVNDKVSVKGSFAQMYQYIHLVSNSAASLPTDIWYPSGEFVKPQKSNQVASGISFSLFGGKYFLSNEVYYKWLNGQIDYKDGAQLFFNDKLYEEFVFGKAWSYGNEIYLEKKSGRLQGWIGYTLSYSWRQFDQINGGKAFHPRYDRRHDISVVASYKLSERVVLSATWIYGTGNAVSLPIGRFAFQNNTPDNPFIVPQYTERNAFRMNAYHRLDLGLVWKFKPKWGESDLTFSIYNAYNRLNPYFLYFATVRDEQTGLPTSFQAKQVSLFPAIPSITYNFKF